MAKNVIFLLTLLVGFADGTLLAEDQLLLRDPMRPERFQPPESLVAQKKLAGKEQAPVWKLKAILISDTRSVAVIDGRLLQVGDEMEGFKLERIDSDRVTLTKKNKKVVLRRTVSGLKRILVEKKGSRQ